MALDEDPNAPGTYWHQLAQDQQAGTFWKCPCGERNPGSYDTCHFCQRANPTPEPQPTRLPGTVFAPAPGDMEACYDGVLVSSLGEGEEAVALTGDKRRFTPTLADVGGFEWDDVPVFEIEEDTVVALTADRRTAASAMTAYFVLVLGIHDTPIIGATPGLRYGVGLFEWEPEDADTPWTMRLGQQGNHHAIPVHYLNLWPTRRKAHIRMNATAVPQAVPGRRITYTHPVTGQVLPGTIASIDEGNLLRARLDGHRLTMTITDTSDRVAYLPETATLPVPVPVGRFQPIPEEMHAIRAGVPLTVVNANDLILLTTDPEDAVAAATAYLPDMGFDPSTVDWDTLEQRWALFEWPEGTTVLTWNLTWGVETDEQAVSLHFLPEPPSAPVA